MECVVNGRRIKYENGAMYWWKTRNGRYFMKEPKWVQFKLSISKTGNGLYETIFVGGKNMKYHRVLYFIHNQDWDITDTSMSNRIDHIDRNSLNNNIENLRVVTQQQNMWNSKGKGYFWSKRHNRFIVRIGKNSKKIEGGSFINEEDAIARAAEMKATHHTF